MGDAGGGCAEELRSPAVTQVPSQGPSTLFPALPWGWGAPSPQSPPLQPGGCCRNKPATLKAPKVIPKMPLPGSYQVVQELLTPCRSPTVLPSCRDVRLAAPAPEIPP